MNTLKRKVIKDVERQWERRNQKRKKYWQQKHNRTEIWEPKAPEALNVDARRPLPKDFVYNKHLSYKSKGLYPVLCGLADYEVNTWVQVSQENLARMAGMSVQTVRKAVEELQAAGLLESLKYDGERKVWLYKVWFPRGEQVKEYEGNLIWFHRGLVDSELWAKPTSRQKVFWLGLRAEGVLDLDYDDLFREELFSHMTYEEMYRRRAYDFWMGSRRKLCKQLGMAPVNIKSEVTDPLAELGMIKYLNGFTVSAYQVYLMPKRLDTNQYFLTPY